MRGAFKKRGVYWIDYYVSGHRKRRCIIPGRRLPETVLRKLNYEHCMRPPSRS
jgi:hypothetical protein